MPEKKFYPMAPSQALLYTGEIAGANSLLVRESNIMGFSVDATDNDHTSEEIADALEKAVNYFVRNNDTLRLRFCRKGLGWKQYVEPFEETCIERRPIESAESFAAYMNETYVGKPNWKKDVLWIGVIGLLGEHEAILAMRVSHFAFDGYSFSLAYRRIKEAYQVYLRGETPVEKPAPSYLAYLDGIAAYKASEQHKADARFWLKANLSLKNYSFPAGYPAIREANSAVVRYLTPDVREKIGAAAAAAECSIAFFFECAVALTVYKLTGKICFNVSTLTHGRTKYTEKQTIGNMANSFSCFFRIEEGNLTDWIRRSYLQYLENVGHSRFPATEAIPFSWKEAFLHGMNFNMSWFLFSSLDFGSAKSDDGFVLATLPRVAQPYQLYGALLDAPDGKVELSLTYQRYKFKKEKAETFIDTFVDVITRMAADPDADIRDVVK